MTVSFGDLTLDTDTRQIRRGAVEVPISPKAFELLTALIDARPRALSKADLHERLWPDTYVTESNLAGLVAEIRRAIGDDARTPRFVRTVQRFGYAFAGEVTPGSSTSSVAISCWLTHGDRQWTLPDGEHVLGRGRNSAPSIQTRCLGGTRESWCRQVRQPSRTCGARTARSLVMNSCRRAGL